MESPVINEVSFTNGSLTVYWKPVTGATSYETNVFDGETPVTGASASGPGFRASIKPNPALSASKNYTVKTRAVMQDGTKSSYSLPFNVVQNPVTAITAKFEGSNLLVTWTPSAFGAVDGADVDINQTKPALDTPVVSTSAKGNSILIPLTKPLSAANTYEVSVSGTSNSGQSSGPGSVLALLVQAPAVGAVNYNNGKITVTAADTPKPPAGTLFLATLFADGVQIAQTAPSADAPVFQQTLDPWVNYTVGLQWSNAAKTAFSPISETIVVVTAKPFPLTTTYDKAKTLIVDWSMPQSATQASEVNIVLLEAGTAVKPQPTWDISGTSATAAIAKALDPAKDYSITITAKRGMSTGPVSNSIDVISATKAVDSVLFNGNQVSASWKSGYGSNVTGYELVLLNGTAPIKSMPAGEASGFIDVDLSDDTATYSVALTPVAGSSSGPLGPSAPILTTAPKQLTFDTSPITGITTLSWAAMPGATAYSLYLEPGHTPVSTTDATYPFTKALPPNSQISVSIGFSVKTANNTTQGPQSSLFSIPTGQPCIVAVNYDGINVAASWTEVSRATGYVLTLLSTNGNTVTVVASAKTDAAISNAVIALDTPVAGTQYSVVVQAYFGASNSGPVSQAMAIFQPGFFLSSASSQTAAPYLYPASKLATVSSPPAAETFSLYFPELGSATLSSLPISIPATKPVFKFQANTDTNKKTYPYQLVIDKTSPAWTFDKSSVRTAIKTAVPALLTALENANAKPWGISMVQEALSRYLPQTFQESMLLAYGMDGSSSSADLRPGMILRVDVNTIQSSGFAENQQWLSGYSGGPVLEYEVSSLIDSSGEWSLGFDNFIGELVSQDLLTVNAPDEGTRWNQQSGVADVADLYYANFPSSFYRLLPPQTLYNTTEACTSDTTKQFVIAAADQYSKIIQAKNTTGGVCPIVYFRGRAIIRLAIRVVLNGTTMVVPVGTTVANLLERNGCSPSLALANLSGLVVERALGPVVTDSAMAISTSRRYPIRFDWKTLSSFNPGWTSLALPLLPGDTVTTG